MHRRSLCAAALALTLKGSVFAGAALAQTSAGPQPVALPPAIAAPQDIPFPGEITLAVNATDTVHRVIKVHETIPVTPGKLVLLYPDWIPGDHSGVGPIQKVAGLFFTANGKPLPWHRDSVNVFAFHLEIPPGTTLLQVDFDYLSGVGPGTGRIEFTREMIDLSWNTVLLYPAGYFARDIRIQPSVTLPAGWQFASSLEPSPATGVAAHFATTTLNTLVDSPLVAGAFFKRIELSPSGAAAPVYLDIFADEAKYLNVDPVALKAHKRLIAEAQRLFGAHHYAHYDFLLMLSNRLGGQGLEHHQSSEDATEADYFTNWAAQTPKNDLLAHEYVHSWNGKFRRPDALWTPNFNVPVQDELLWVYEGLTQYWGYQLAARSGLRSADTTKDLLASVAAGMQENAGRQWRTIEDTGNHPILSTHGSTPWSNWERQSDYYMEGVLVWLDVDMKIRELSHDAKSLDDFGRLFHGMDNGSIITRTYAFDDIVNSLQQVQPYDWQTFLRTRVYQVQDQIPTGGFTNGGYRLVYNDTKPAWIITAKPAYIPGQNVAALGFTGNGSYMTSLGFALAPDGTLTRVWWSTPAFTAGLIPGMKLTQVNGSPYSDTTLHDAILHAKATPQPIHLHLENTTESLDVDLDYHGGLRYPHLEPIPNTPDRLGASLAAAAK